MLDVITHPYANFNDGTISGISTWMRNNVSFFTGITWMA